MLTEKDSRMEVRVIKRWIGRIGCAVLAGGLLILQADPVYAASRKKISTVKVTVESNILPGTSIGDEEIEIKTPSSGQYTYDYYEVLNTGSEWDETMVPEIKITLTAKEGYYFALRKKSQVTIKGATYVTAAKQNSSENLLITVKLPSLAESIGEMGEVTLTEGGYVYWDPVQGAGSYEMRIYRNGSAMNVTELVTSETMNNIQDKIRRAGDYSVKVRARNQVKQEKKTEWSESNIISLNAEQAKNIKDGKMPEKPITGEWRKTDDKWWYAYEDGTYPSDGWRQIDGKWYFFDTEGYMQTGWIEWEGKEYYCDQNTGAMLTNTVTPDGYYLDGNGNKASS